MNFIFHLAAALALIGLAWMILRMQRQRDLLAGLLRQSAFGGPAQIRLESPARFLQRFAEALGIPFEDSLTAKLPIVRIQSNLLGKVFVEQGIRRIECKQENGQNVVHFHLANSAPEAQKQLTDALGGALIVTTIGVNE